MKHLVTESREPVGEEEVAAVERELGVQLPTEYRDFLMAHNGGCISPAHFPIHGNPHGGSKVSYIT